MSTDDTSTSSDQPKRGAEGSITEIQLTVPFPESFTYSNVSAISSSFMDVRIGFGEAMPDGTAQPRIGVVMPPEHAAQLVLNLLQQLNFFEKNFGEIRHPIWKNFRAKANAEAALNSKEP
jgi:hypothetical protein